MTKSSKYGIRPSSNKDGAFLSSYGQTANVSNLLIKLEWDTLELGSNIGKVSLSDFPVNNSLSITFPVWRTSEQDLMLFFLIAFLR